MPYTKDNPPEKIKGLPTHAQDIWIAAFNSALKEYEDEGKANAIAWSAVEKAGYKKDKDGKWHKENAIMELWESVKRLFEPLVQQGDQAPISATAYLPTQTRSFVITRQADGKARWLLIAASAVVNKANAIDSTRLFDNFIIHARDSHEYPILDFLHEEERIRFGVADWLQRDGALYLASGTFDDTELARAAINGLETQPDYWGASISYRITEPPMLLVAEGEIPVYTNGVNNFISIVPKRMAANLFTAAVVTEEVRRMNKQTYDELVRLIGEAAAKQFADQVDDANRTIAEVGMVVRSDETVVTPVEETKPEPKAEPPIEQRQEPPAEQPAPEPPKVTLEQLVEIVNDLRAQVAELKAGYGMMEESRATADTEQKRAMTTLDNIASRLAGVEASKASWDNWIADAPEHLKEQAGIIRARDTEPKPMTMKQLAEKNLAGMNRGPHMRHNQPQ